MVAEEAPKITDWMQAWGSLAGLVMSTIAVIFTGLLLRHEIRVRREEKRDAETAQARLVVATLEQPNASSPATRQDRRFTSLHRDGLRLGYRIMNFSSAPILDVMIRHTWSGGSMGPTEHIPVLMGEEKGDLRLGEGLDPAVLDIILASSGIEIVFTDANGQRWKRVDRGAPERLVGRTYFDPSIIWVAIVATIMMVAAALAGAGVNLLVH